MREYATPATVGTPGAGSLTTDVLSQVEHGPDTVLFRRRGDSGAEWHDVSAVAFRDEVVAVAKGLVAAGVRSGDRVGLMSRTRYEWTLVDYACWWVGAVTVPVYDSSPAAQVVHALADSGAAACVVETSEHLDLLRSRSGDMPDVQHMWALDERGIDSLTALGDAVTDEVLEARRAAVAPEDLATILYTSGTTGPPKGCCLSHANFLVGAGELTAALPELFDQPGRCTLLFLPLAQILPRLVQVACVRSGTPLGHVSDTIGLAGVMREFRPTFIVTVPRVLEQLLPTASDQEHEGVRGRLLDPAATTAVAYSRALDDGGAGVLLRARHRAYDRLMYSGFRASLGGRLRHVLAGGDPLSERLGHFYRGSGLPVLESYGLTESTALLSVNARDEHKVGTVGRPLPGTTVRVADDGELLARGAQIFPGYWAAHPEAREATAAVLAEGWLHTGDTGEIDAEGYVRVSGRKAELLVTAGGKRVAPAVLEDLIRQHPLVGQCVVVGDGRPYVAALISLNPDAAAAWAERNGHEANLEKLSQSAQLRTELQAAVDTANASVSHAESVRRFEVLSVALTEDAGHLTPTLKLRRAVVLADFRREIAALYEER